MRCQCASGSPHGRVRAWARARRQCVRTRLAPWAVRRARIAPVLHRRLWIDAGCVAAGGGCSIDFARAPASRGGCWPAIARGSALRDGEEARPRPGAPPMHRRSAPLQAAACANSHLATRAREGFCVRGRARVGRLKEPAKRRARPSPLAASRPRGREVDLPYGCPKEAPRRGRHARGTSRTTSRRSAWRRSTRTPRTSPTASSASSSARWPRATPPSERPTTPTP